MDFLFTKKRKAIKHTKEKILFIYPLFSSFVKTDYNILSEKYDVIKFQYVHKKSIFAHIVSQIKINIWLLKRIFSAKAVYIWFADYHSFLPILFAKLFNKKSFLVLGGYDVTYIPEFNYGTFNNPIRAFCAKQSVKNATVNLAVSKFVVNQALKIVPKVNLELIYNGVNLEKFKSTVGKRKNRILTVGAIDSDRRVKIKGIDVFIKAAEAMPEYEFVIIGITKKMQLKLGKIPDNLVMIEQVPHDELVGYYSSSKVYCQFSIVESFGLALAEAMACGCVGVISNRGALPEVIGESGFIVNTEAVPEIKEKIERAILLSEKENSKSVKMVKDNFSIDNRKQKIFEVFKKYGI